MTVAKVETKRAGVRRGERVARKAGGRGGEVVFTRVMPRPRH